MSTLMIYVLQMGSDGPMKVGVSTDVERRRRQIEAGSPYPIHVLFAKPGSRALERAIHRQFAPRRLRGEWFEPAAEILTAVEQGVVTPVTNRRGEQPKPYNAPWFAMKAREAIEVIAWPRPTNDRIDLLIDDVTEKTGLPRARVKAYWHNKVPTPWADEVGTLALTARELGGAEGRDAKAPRLCAGMLYVASMFDPIVARQRAKDEP